MFWQRFRSQLFDRSVNSVRSAFYGNQAARANVQDTCDHSTTDHWPSVQDWMILPMMRSLLLRSVPSFPNRVYLARCIRKPARPPSLRWSQHELTTAVREEVSDNQSCSSINPVDQQVCWALIDWTEKLWVVSIRIRKSEGSARQVNTHKGLTRAMG